MFTWRRLTLAAGILAILWTLAPNGSFGQQRNLNVRPQLPPQPPPVRPNGAAVVLPPGTVQSFSNVNKSYLGAFPNNNPFVNPGITDPWSNPFNNPWNNPFANPWNNPWNNNYSTPWGPTNTWNGVPSPFGPNIWQQPNPFLNQFGWNPFNQNVPMQPFMNFPGNSPFGWNPWSPMAGNAPIVGGNIVGFPANAFPNGFTGMPNVNGVIGNNNANGFGLGGGFQPLNQFVGGKN